jgi:dipeptidyl aminopeptidase/acylaminoacyl peptidase
MNYSFNIQKKIMKKNFILSGLLIFALTCTCCKKKENNKCCDMKTIPVEDFFRNPEKTAFQISPKGKYFSFLAPVNQRMNIFVQETGKDTAIQISFEKDRDVAAYFWANENRILFLKDQGGDENFKLFAVDADGSNPRGLTDFEGVKTRIIDDLEDNPDEVIISMNKRKAEVFDPYRLNIQSGELTMLAENPGNIQAWMTDHDGKLRLAIAIVDKVNNSILYRDNEKDTFKTLISTNFKHAISPLFFTFDNQKFYVSSNINRDKSIITIFDPKTKKETGEVIYEHPEYDVSSLSYSRKRKVLTATSYTDWKRRRHFFDPQTKALFQRLEKDLGTYEISITSTNREEDKFIVRTYSDRSLGAYYFYDKKSDSLKKICDVSPWLKEEDLAEMKPIEYKSRDGLTIHGYLTLPKVSGKDKFALVVHPHGGPWVRDVWTYNPEVQFLANRGYAVFQMNYRGSTGYGKEFWMKSFKEWGKSMQDDISDGVHHLIQEGIADPDKIAIYGGSYGGYATLAGVTFTPDLYACGIDYVGVSNLFTFMKTIPPYWKTMLDMMYEMVGNPNIEEDSIKMREVSPVFHADKIRVPMFIAQGANDPRVNINESDQIVEALKKNNIEVEYMVKDNEGHGFRNEENKFDFYNAMSEFLQKHLGTCQEEKQ